MRVGSSGTEVGGGPTSRDVASYSGRFGAEEEAPPAAVDDVERCCESPDPVEEGGFVVCRNCGVVLGQIYTGASSRGATEEAKKKTATSEVVTRKTGSRTVIGETSGLSPAAAKRYRDLKRVEKWGKSPKEKRLAKLLPTWTTVGNALSVTPALREDVARILNEAIESNLTKGRKGDVLVAAAYFAAFRIYKSPKVVDDVVKAANLEPSERKKVLDTFILLQKNGVITRAFRKKRNGHYAVTPGAYVYTLSPILKLSPEDAKLANALAEAVGKAGYSAGKNPKGVAAAAIYVVVGDRRDFTDAALAATAGVSASTVKKNVKAMTALLADVGTFSPSISNPR